MEKCGARARFGNGRGADIHQLLERLGGLPCPGSRGGFCPLIPAPLAAQAVAESAEGRAPVPLAG